jgi:hypothetical protein
VHHRQCKQPRDALENYLPSETVNEEIHKVARAILYDPKTALHLEKPRALSHRKKFSVGQIAHRDGVGCGISIAIPATSVQWIVVRELTSTFGRARDLPAA